MAPANSAASNVPLSACVCASLQVDPGAEQLLARMLARHPAQRPTMQQARAAMAGWCLEALVGARVPAGNTKHHDLPPCSPSDTGLSHFPSPCLFFVSQVIDHSWFQTDLPPGALTLNDELLTRTVDDPALADRCGSFDDCLRMFLHIY